MTKTWLLVKITFLFAAATTLIRGLIWLVEHNPHHDPAALPMIYLFLIPWILANILLLSWCLVYNFKHPEQAETHGYERSADSN